MTEAPQDRKTVTPLPPPPFKRRRSLSSLVLLALSVLLAAFLVLNHFAALLVICTPVYQTPNLCELIGSSRTFTFVGDLDLVLKDMKDKVKPN